MSKKSVPAVVELSESSPQSRRFSDEFKRELVRLVTDEKYTFQAAATAVGVSQKSLRDWHAKLAPQPVSALGVNESRAVTHGGHDHVRLVQ